MESICSSEIHTGLPAAQCKKENTCTHCKHRMQASWEREQGGQEVNSGITVYFRGTETSSNSADTGFGKKDEHGVFMDHKARGRRRRSSVGADSYPTPHSSAGPTTWASVHCPLPFNSEHCSGNLFLLFFHPFVPRPICFPFSGAIHLLLGPTVSFSP